MKKLIFLLVMFVLLLTITVNAKSNLPTGILKVQEYNQQLAQNILQNVSFFIAFLAGITTLLSPCILPLLPAYFAITFQEKKKITLATSIFFLGFTTVFIIMGLLATLTGKTLISVFRNINWLVPLFGIMLMIFGIMIFLGRGFTGLSFKRKTKGNVAGMYLSGIAFAVGWTACIGPILSGVLLMTSTYQNYVTSSLLMLGYSLGIFIPLFLFSFFYDKIHLEKIKWLYKEVNLKINKKTIKTTYPNIIAGSLYLLLGLIFLIFKGTWIVNGLQMFGLRKYFYNWQNNLLKYTSTFETIGLVLFVTFIITLLLFLIKQIGGKK